MGVAGAGDVFGRGAELHGDGGLGDHGLGVGAEDVHAEHAIGLGVGEDFDKAVGGEIGAGAGVGGERKFSGRIGDAGVFQFLFGFADAGDLRERVDDVRDHVVIDVAGLAGEQLGDRDALLFGLVRQHRTGDGVADGVDAGD